MAVPASDTVFLDGLTTFGDVVAAVRPEQWEEPSACEGWRNLDVLGHMGSAMGMGISILRGQEPTWPQAERMGDLVEGEPTEYWARLADEARAALVGVDLDEERDSPMGRRTMGQGLAFPAIDLYVHAWDIGSSAGVAVTIPDDVVAFAHQHLDPIPEEMMRGERGVFGPEVDPPVGATTSERFLAFTGRTPR